MSFESLAKELLVCSFNNSTSLSAEKIMLFSMKKVYLAYHLS